MRKRFGLFAALLLVLLVSLETIYAQEATDTLDAGWPVEERCVGKPTKAPKGWKYEGTILMTGYAGIHGVNVKWDTPRVLVFLGENDIWGGALSPDGNWYASPKGGVEVTDTHTTISSTDEIEVYSTIDNELTLHIPIKSFGYGGFHGQVYWRDNENFIYPDLSDEKLINISTNKITTWDKLEVMNDSYSDFISSFAPDWSKVIYYRADGNGTSTPILWDLNQSIETKTLSLRNPTMWKPDSSGFITDMAQNLNHGEGKPNEALSLFDSNGKLLEKVFLVPDGQQIGRLNAAWSSDGRYFAFIAFNYYAYGDTYYTQDYDTENTLYILDTQEHLVINTCLKSGIGFVWSPIKHQLAFLESGYGLQNIYILDTDSSEFYTIGKHIFHQPDTVNGRQNKVGIIGWQID